MYISRKINGRNIACTRAGAPPRINCGARFSRITTTATHLSVSITSISIMASSSQSKPPLSEAALANIPAKYHAQSYQRTPNQDAFMRAHQKRKDQRRSNRAHELDLNESLNLNKESHAVIRRLLHYYPDQFEEMNGVLTRRKPHVPMLQTRPIITLCPLLPVGLWSINQFQAGHIWAP